MVYCTDALKSDKVRILGTFPEKSHNPILYVAGVCKENKEAEDFYAFLNSGEAKDIWMKFGFKK